MAKITVQNTPITVLNIKEQDYISLTDMATAKDGDSRAADIIKNWLRNRYTIEFLGTWELIHNPNFKVVEFDHFRMSAGLPSFVLSASEWIERTEAIGLNEVGELMAKKSMKTTSSPTSAEKEKLLYFDGIRNFLKFAEFIPLVLISQATVLMACELKTCSRT